MVRGHQQQSCPQAFPITGASTILPPLPRTRSLPAAPLPVSPVPFPWHLPSLGGPTSIDWGLCPGMGSGMEMVPCPVQGTVVPTQTGNLPGLPQLKGKGKKGKAKGIKA